MGITDVSKTKWKYGLELHKCNCPVQHNCNACNDFGEFWIAANGQHFMMGELPSRIPGVNEEKKNALYRAYDDKLCVWCRNEFRQSLYLCRDCSDAHLANLARSTGYTAIDSSGEVVV